MATAFGIACVFAIVLAGANMVTMWLVIPMDLQQAWVRDGRNAGLNPDLVSTDSLLQAYFYLYWVTQATAQFSSIVLFLLKSGYLTFGQRLKHWARSWLTVRAAFLGTAFFIYLWLSEPDPADWEHTWVHRLNIFVRGFLNMVGLLEAMTFMGTGMAYLPTIIWRWAPTRRKQTAKDLVYTLRDQRDAARFMVKLAHAQAIQQRDRFTHTSSVMVALYDHLIDHPYGTVNIDAFANQHLVATERTPLRKGPQKTPIKGRRKKKKAPVQRRDPTILFKQEQHTLAKNVQQLRRTQRDLDEITAEYARAKLTYKQIRDHPWSTGSTYGLMPVTIVTAVLGVASALLVPLLVYAECAIAFQLWARHSPAHDDALVIANLVDLAADVPYLAVLIALGFLIYFSVCVLIALFELGTLQAVNVYPLRFNSSMDNASLLKICYYLLSTLHPICLNFLFVVARNSPSHEHLVYYNFWKILIDDAVLGKLVMSVWPWVLALVVICSPCKLPQLVDNLWRSRVMMRGTASNDRLIYDETEYPDSDDDSVWSDSDFEDDSDDEDDDDGFFDDDDDEQALLIGMTNTHSVNFDDIEAGRPSYGKQKAAVTKDNPDSTDAGPSADSPTPAYKPTQQNAAAPAEQTDVEMAAAQAADKPARKPGPRRRKRSRQRSTLPVEDEHRVHFPRYSSYNHMFEDIQAVTFLLEHLAAPPNDVSLILDSMQTGDQIHQSWLKVFCTYADEVKGKIGVLVRFREAILSYKQIQLRRERYSMSDEITTRFVIDPSLTLDDSITLQILGDYEAAGDDLWDEAWRSVLPYVQREYPYFVGRIHEQLKRRNFQVPEIQSSPALALKASHGASEAKGDDDELGGRERANSFESVSSVSTAFTVSTVDSRHSRAGRAKTRAPRTKRTQRAGRTRKYYKPRVNKSLDQSEEVLTDDQQKALHVGIDVQKKSGLAWRHVVLRVSRDNTRLFFGKDDDIKESTSMKRFLSITVKDDVFTFSLERREESKRKKKGPKLVRFKLHKNSSQDELEHWLGALMVLLPGRVRDTAVILLPAVFGLELNKALQRKRATVLPVPLQDCLEFLEKHGMDTPDLFRKSATDEVMVEHLRELYDCERLVVLTEEPHVGPHEVASLMKLYLDMLPEPVFTPAVAKVALSDVEQAVSAHMRKNRSSKLDAMHEVATAEFLAQYVDMLADPQRNVLYHVLFLLNRLAFNTSRNQLTGPTLATLFAPTLFATEAQAIDFDELDDDNDSTGDDDGTAFDSGSHARATSSALAGRRKSSQGAAGSSSMAQNAIEDDGPSGLPPRSTSWRGNGTNTVWRVPMSAHDLLIHCVEEMIEGAPVLFHDEENIEGDTETQ